MTFLEWVEFLGPMRIFTSCCLKPVGAIFLFFGIILVKRSDTEDEPDKMFVWLGAAMIASGILCIVS